MHESRILEFLLIALGLRGLVLTFITAIGDPINDFKPTAILSRYISLIAWIKTKKWLSPFDAWVSIYDNIGNYKVLICGYCLNFWLSIPLFYYYLYSSNFKTAIISIGVYLLIINKIK